MAKYLILLLFVSTAIFSQTLFPPMPSVPGSLCEESDQDFKEHRYRENVIICERNVTSPRKDKVCLRDGVSDRSNYNVDHIIPLFMGGSNHDDNLWCQHKSIYTGKEEQQIYLKLREDEITQAQAITIIKKIKFKTIQKNTIEELLLPPSF
jgi:hypothetical protein